MNRKVMITCALTGAGDTVGRSEHVPVTPEQIADAGIAAARAGATIVHVHVRDPQTGQGSREVAFYREAVERIRASDVDVIINTTAGMGGDLVLDPQHPTSFVEGTDLVSGVERLKHVEELLPEICTLDCGSLNFGEGSLVYVSTPDMLRDGAKRIQELGVRVEMEIFDTGHLWFANQLVEEGFIDAPPMYQLCMDIPYGAPADSGPARGHGRPAAGQRRVDVLRARADADAVGGPVGAARRPRPRRPRGQPLPEQGRQGDQRAARRARPDHRRVDGRRGGDPGRGPRDPRPEAEVGVTLTDAIPRWRWPTSARSAASGPVSSAEVGRRTSSPGATTSSPGTRRPTPRNAWSTSSMPRGRR